MLRADAKAFGEPEGLGEPVDRLANVRVDEDRDDLRRGDRAVRSHPPTIRGRLRHRDRLALGRGLGRSEWRRSSGLWYDSVAVSEAQAVADVRIVPELSVR